MRNRDGTSRTQSYGETLHSGTYANGRNTEIYDYGNEVELSMFSAQEKALPCVSIGVTPEQYALIQKADLTSTIFRALSQFLDSIEHEIRLVQQELED